MLDLSSSTQSTLCCVCIIYSAISTVLCMLDLSSSTQPSLYCVHIIYSAISTVLCMLDLSSSTQSTLCCGCFRCWQVTWVVLPLAQLLLRKSANVSKPPDHLNSLSWCEHLQPCLQSISMPDTHAYSAPWCTCQWSCLQWSWYMYPWSWLQCIILIPTTLIRSAAYRDVCITDLICSLSGCGWHLLIFTLNSLHDPLWAVCDDALGVLFLLLKDLNGCAVGCV